MEAIIDHYPEHGGYIQVAHGDHVVSLVVTKTIDGEKRVGAAALKPEEAIDLALDLIVQARHSM